ncbi:MAG: cadherin-like domain-containing protein, partial [Bacteroidetes bacterium]|nr:cadherin-like domain-containing protein [Bacteroidota bacterium]
YLYTAPVGVDSLLSDIICVSIYNEQNNYTEETYLELIFADIQDPQFETNLLCCSSGDIFAHFLIKGVCEEGYTWVNNNDTTQGGMIYCYIVCLENLIFQIDETTGYNYTFTNNCTGESVTISGEADCGYNTINIPIEALDDPQPPVAYGNPITITIAYLAYNDYGDGPVVQSLCSESANGGTIIDNGDGTATYYPPTEVSYLPTDSFCYEMTDATGQTDMANVIFNFTENQSIDPILEATQECGWEESGNNITPSGLYNLYITVLGDCDEGYTWVNNYTPSQGGEVFYNALIDVGVIVYYGASSPFSNGYSFSVINNCTGEIAVLEDVDACRKICTPYSIDDIAYSAKYEEAIILSEEILRNSALPGKLWEKYSRMELCEVSENGGKIIQSEHGTYIYNPPSGETLVSDKICATLYNEHNESEETYIDLKFLDQQDPQLSISTDCSHSAETYDVIIGLLGECEEGYTWTNNKGANTGGQCKIARNTPLKLTFLKENDYNLTFTNNCTGESVTISGEAECAIYTTIDAIDDRQDAVEYGNPITIVGETLLLNDFGDSISLQSVCIESENGGTVINNGDGTYTYNPPADTAFLATDNFCYTIVDANGDTATANVIFYFYNNPQDDPTLMLTTHCQVYDEGVSNGYFDLLITIFGKCMEGYTWVSNDPTQAYSGEIQLDSLTKVAYLQLVLPSDNERGYDITITSKCTGISQNLSQWVYCSSFICSLPICNIFDGRVLAQGNELTWRYFIVNEDIAYFTLARAIDGVTFEPIGKIMPDLTNSTEYVFLDQDAPEGVSYYRLSWTDTSGVEDKYNIIPTLTRDKASTDAICVYPNPTKETLYLDYASKTTAESSLKIYDIWGRVVLEKSLATYAGFNQEQLNIADFAPGTYFLVLIDGDKKTSTKFIKK